MGHVWRVLKNNTAIYSSQAQPITLNQIGTAKTCTAEENGREWGKNGRTWKKGEEATDPDEPCELVCGTLIPAAQMVPESESSPR